MEWKLSELKKTQYFALLKTAQDVEKNIGSAQYRIFKLSKLREQTDLDLQGFWNEVAKDLNLDTKMDYFIDLDGVVKLVPVKEKSPITAPEVPKDEPMKIPESYITELK
jgi:hypothetical protein